LTMISSLVLGCVLPRSYRSWLKNFKSGGAWRFFTGIRSPSAPTT
jgi:hypothetical protein